MSPVHNTTVTVLPCAAQIHDRHGNVYKFDDISCMLRFSHALGLDDAALFVMDCTTGKDWLTVRQATFVKSEAISSSTSSRLGAFRTRTSADDFVADNRGQIFTFDELLSSYFGRTHNVNAP